MTNTPETTEQETFVWHSPLHSIAAEQAKRRMVANAEIVEAIADDATEQQLAIVAGVCDLSPLPRMGGKGVCAQSLPPLNEAAATDSGNVCCKLAGDELLLLANDSDESAKLEDITNLFDKVHCTILRRDSHCQIGLCGERAVHVLSHVCALPPPFPGIVLQTLVADIGAIIIGMPDNRPKNSQAPKTAHPFFYLLADSGYAVHLWEELTQAAAVQGGGAIGWRAWRNARQDYSAQSV